MSEKISKQLQKKPEVVLVKIGGGILDDPDQLEDFLSDFSGISTPKILLHGGGKTATQVARQMRLPIHIVEGRRVTNEETLRVAIMVYGGYINKTLVARLQSLGCDSLGITGADRKLICAHRRPAGQIDYGWVGDIDAINISPVKDWFAAGITPVIAPLTYSDNGILLNTNADTVATMLAEALAPEFDVTLILAFEQPGILENKDDPSSLIPQITQSKFRDLQKSHTITDGMIPKLDNGFRALNNGVKHICIGHTSYLNAMVCHQDSSNYSQLIVQE